MQNKSLVVLCVLLLGVASCKNTKKQEQAEGVGDSVVSQRNEDLVIPDSSDRRFISDMVSAFIIAYNEGDNAKVNSFIHPDAGIMIIHRPGAMDWFERVERLDFSKPVPSYYPYSKARHNYPLLYEQAPTYDCSLEKWSKEGLIIDLTTQTNLLAPIAVSLQEFDDVELDPDHMKQIEVAEKNSYRVVLTTATPLIFHVKQIDNSWYVTILDRGYADCGA